MNRFLHGMVRAVSESFTLPEPMVEIGSYQVEGQEKIINLRTLFPDRAYTGMDMRPGPGVDLVANVEKLPQPDASVGTVLSVSTFEHVRCFWKGFDEVRRIFRPDGVLVVACPFHFHIHNYPDDYWRFTPAALEVLLERYPSKIIGWHGAKRRPSSVWAVAFREDRPAITPEQYSRYRALVKKYAYQPEESRTRWLRYKLASLWCGRGPFASYLDRNEWDSICLNATAKAA